MEDRRGTGRTETGRTETGWGVRAALAGLACAAAAACASTDMSGDADDAPLRVYGNLTTIEIAPVLLALDAGLYEGPSTLTHGGVPNLYDEGGVEGLFDDGVADVATNAETQALRVSVEHPDLRILMTVSEGLYRIVARRSSGIETLEDLRGKRIGTVANTSSNYFLHKMLTTAGLTIDDVEFVRVWPMDEYHTAFEELDLDAITIWEPGAEYAAASIGDDAIEFHDPTAYREVFNLNTTAGALADPVLRPKIVAFVAAIVEATEQLEADPSAAQALVAESSGYPLETVEDVWRHHAYPARLVDDMLDVLEEEEVWVSRETGRTPRTREELATLIDTSIIEEVLADR